MQISDPNLQPRPSIVKLCAEEPFRVFFPLGLLAATVGMLLWPLFYWGAVTIYPAFPHARLMTQGFLGAFILGFLGTAGPRLLDTRRFSIPEIGAVLALHGAALIFHLFHRMWMGDALYFGALIVFTVALATRYRRSETLPPPNFVLVGMGMLSAVTGMAFILWAGEDYTRFRFHLIGNLLVSQAFVLLPILGVGVFFFPRVLGTHWDGSLAELRKPNALWRQKAWIAVAAGLLLIASYVVDSFGHLRAAGLLRFVVAFAYLATQVPDVLRFRRAPLVGQSIRISMWLLLLGLVWSAILPNYRVAGLHLVFIGGFMLVTLSVATRVILGHTGQSSAFAGRMPFFVTTMVLLILGALTRVGADFMTTPRGRDVHLVYAALLCIGAVIVWGIRLLPRILVPDEEEEEVQAPPQ